MQIGRQEEEWEGLGEALLDWQSIDDFPDWLRNVSVTSGRVAIARWGLQGKR
ncbi:MAG: hypothetical protein ACUVSQ_13100 [Pseudanabaenaceae cyanobacterium]